MTPSTWLLIIILTGGWGGDQRLVIPFPDKASCEVAWRVVGSEIGRTLSNVCVPLGVK